MPRKSKSQKNYKSYSKKGSKKTYSDSESNQSINSPQKTPMSEDELSSDVESTCGDIIDVHNNVEIENIFQEIEYVDYDLIKNIKYKINKDEKHVKVKCFYNGNKWVCPNPLNNNLCEYVENWYSSTHLVKMREIHMSLDMFNIMMNSIIARSNEPIILSEL
jgi:hypothetical protein